MPARALPNLGLQAFFDLGEDGWDDEMNLNILKMSVLIQGGVAEKLAAEPGAPAEGDVVVLDETHATQANAIAVYDDGAWVYFAPSEGWLIYDRSTDAYLTFDGAVWDVLETGGGGGLADAPEDGKQYGREDGEWTEIVSGGGGGGGVPEVNVYTHEVAVGAFGGPATAGSWVARPLTNDGTAEITGASRTGNQITLPAGRYRVSAFQTFFDTDYCHSRLYDTTGAAVLVRGGNGYASSTATDIRIDLEGVFTLAVESVIEFQYRVTSASNANAFGVSNLIVERAIMAQIMLEKIT